MNFLEIPSETNSMALEQIAEQVALEALSISSVVNRLSDLIPDLVHAAKNFMGERNRDKPTLLRLSVNPGTLVKALTPTTFTNIGSLNHPVPPGFKGNLYEYAVTLKNNMEYAMTVPTALTDFNVFVSQIISSEQARKSIRSNSQIVRERVRARKAIVAATAPFFSTGSRITNARYDSVIASNNQYIQFVDEVGVLLGMCSQVSVDHVEELVNDTHELLQTVSTNAAEGKLTGMSSEMLEELGLFTESIARDVEMFSLTLWAISSLRDAAQRGSESMIKALRY